MYYKDLFYTPQDIAKFIYDINLGVKSQEPLINAIWQKEYSFILPQYRVDTYKNFYQCVTRYLDGCVDIRDKKRDIDFLNQVNDGTGITYKKEDYITETSKLKYLDFKTIRLSLLFFCDGKCRAYRWDTLLSNYDNNAILIEQCLAFYHLKYHIYTDGQKQTIPLHELENYSYLLYFSLFDGDGIYNIR